MTDAPNTITITLNTEDLDGQIISAAVERLLNIYSYDDEGNEHRRASNLESRISSKIDESIKEIVKDRVEAFTDELLKQPVRKLDSYGQPMNNGDTISIIELMQQRMMKELTDRGPNYNSSTNQKGSVLHTYLNDVADKVVKELLDAEVKAARKEVHDRIKGKAAELLAAETMRAAGLRP